MDWLTVLPVNDLDHPDNFSPTLDGNAGNGPGFKSGGFADSTVPEGIFGYVRNEKWFAG